jgi:putative DNA methylase
VTPKRLIEVDLPIARISAAARSEKSIRHGHISTLHIWWARRPLAACRAVMLAALLPDPADPHCPAVFREAASSAMRGWRDKRGGKGRDWAEPLEVRAALLDFIADYASWSNSSDPGFIEMGRSLVSSAHEALGGQAGTRPMVVDSFAGGGAIPLEALRVGADAFASDLNPVAVLLEKFVLEMIPRHGHELARRFSEASKLVQSRAEGELGPFYPADDDGSQPIAYLWARTVISDAPGASDPPVEIPMLTTMWLSERPGKLAALRWQRDRDGHVVTTTESVTQVGGRSVTVRRPHVEVFTPNARHEVDPAPVTRSAVTCPVTGHTTSADAVRNQFAERRGGADDARLIVVVTGRPGQTGRQYRLPLDRDFGAVKAAETELARQRMLHDGPTSLVPDEELPYLRSIFNINLLGVSRWGDLFTARQALSIATYVRLVREVVEGAETGPDLARAIHVALALAVDRVADKCASLVVWDVTGENAAHVFGRQALGIVWDFADVNPLGDVGWTGASEWIRKVIEENGRLGLPPGLAVLASATAHPMPDDSADLFFTDPPYYDAVPYADLSDFFYVWLRRSIGRELPDLFQETLSPKAGEIVQLAERNPKYAFKTREYFQDLMRQAMSEGRRVLRPGGIGVVVFAHKTTTGWETQLQSMLDAGWTVTGSWPIDTEMATRLRAKDSAVLASSIHLVCRPREEPDGRVDHSSVGDWRDVLTQLPIRIHEWMPRLAMEGVVGADAIFACLGPALEVFSRYSRVEKASGEKVRLKEYLEHVWAAVAREAIGLVFADADAAALEEDARLTAMWLWTLRPAVGPGPADVPEQPDEGASSARGGYVLEYDAARKIAQGLGVDLQALPTVVAIKGETARLLGIRERASHLVGIAAHPRPPSRSRGDQLRLFVEPEMREGPGDLQIGEILPSSTTLGRLHQAMILFGAGRSDALQRFLADGPGADTRFWSLAQSLSALYPGGTDEKRWVDGVLVRKRSFGY